MGKGKLWSDYERRINKFFKRAFIILRYRNISKCKWTRLKIMDLK